MRIRFAQYLRRRVRTGENKPAKQLMIPKATGQPMLTMIWTWLRLLSRENLPYEVISRVH